MYPDDAVQSLVSPWWTAERATALTRGRLVHAYAQHSDARSFVLTVEGRKEPSDPSRARMRIAPVSADVPERAPSPPSPALPLEPGEAWTVRRARWRPCLVLGVSGPAVHRPLRTAAAETHVGPALLVAPYFEAAGLSPEFVTRVRRAEYAHCVWDRLPLAGNREVILRLDLLQPLARDPLGFEWADHALSAGALATVDAWLHWNLTGTLAPGDLHEFRELVRGA